MHAVNVYHFAPNNLQNFPSCKSLYCKYCLRIGTRSRKKKSRIAFKVAIVSTEQVYSIALIVSYALQEFEMLTLFLFRAISNGTKERSCQDCLTFTETLPRDSFQWTTECKWSSNIHITDNRGLLAGWPNTAFWLVNFNCLANTWTQHWRWTACISIRDRHLCIFSADAVSGCIFPPQ